MKTLTSEEVEEFYVKNGYNNPLVDRSSTLLPAFYYNFELEDHTNSDFVLANFLAIRSTSADCGLAVIENVTIWESGVNWHLVEIVLTSCLGKEYVGNVEGIVLEYGKQDFQDIRTLIHVAMMFGWDMFLMPSDHQERVFLSHDSFFEIHSTKNMKEIANSFREHTGRNL